MKIQLLLALLIGGVISITGCSKNKGTCENGVLDYDAGEIEIDCGGPCEACPPAASFSATVGGFSYVANSISGHPDGTSGIYIGSSGTSGTYVNFTFVGTTLNTSLPITAVAVQLTSSFYSFELGDTGSVVLTAIDTQRKIVSGRVNFNATETSGSGSTTVQNGVFENVRYQY